MNMLKNRYRILGKIVAMAVVCLFSFNTLTWTMPPQSVPGSSSTLAVQSIFRPILDMTGFEYSTQLRVEVTMILEMILQDDRRPFQDINAVLDEWYTGAPDKRRLLNVISGPALDGDTVAVEVEVFQGPRRGEKFRIVSSCKSLDEYYEDVSRVKVEPIPSEKVEDARPGRDPDAPLKSSNTMVVTIDGPSGSGKSTVARITAKRLGAEFLSYGKVYRLITWLALKDGIRLDDNIRDRLDDLISIAGSINMRLFSSKEINGEMRYFYSGEDITEIFYSEDISKNVALVAEIPEVREIAARELREVVGDLTRRGVSVVLEGRVTGIEIAPEAPVKIYLTAELRERAGRRADQIIATSGLKEAYCHVFDVPEDVYERKRKTKTEDELRDEIIDAVAESTTERDTQDRERHRMPATRPPGAVVVDSTGKVLKETLDEVFEVIEDSYPSLREAGFSPVTAPDALYTLKEEAAREVEEVLSHEAASIMVDPETGERRYFKQGRSLIPVNAHVYVKEGRSWNLPSDVELPAYMDGIMNSEEGALLLMAGPFFVKQEGMATVRDIRSLSDHEVYERFGLRRVHDKDGEPFEIPVLGIGGRSILLPVPYTIGKRHVFGLEFKNVGTPAYEKHNISTDFPSTTFEEHVGKPGVFLDWWHQMRTRYPVGLGVNNAYPENRETGLLARDGKLTRWTLDVMHLEGPYCISLRAPVNDYRRLTAFFDEDEEPDKDAFDAILEELGLTVEEYLPELAANYGKNMRIVVAEGIIQAQHGSIINFDISGYGTDFEDFYKIADATGRGREDFFKASIHDWVDNLVKVMNIAGPEHKQAIDNALREFAVRFLRGADRLEGVTIDADDTAELKDIIYERALDMALSEFNPEPISGVPPGSKIIKKYGKTLCISPRASKGIREMHDFIRKKGGVVEAFGLGLTRKLEHDETTTVVIDFIPPEEDKILAVEIEDLSTYPQVQEVIRALFRSNELTLTVKDQKIAVISDNARYSMTIADDEWMNVWDFMGELLSRHLPADVDKMKDLIRQEGDISLPTDIEMIVSCRNSFFSDSYFERVNEEAGKQKALPNYSAHYHPNVAFRGLSPKMISERIVKPSSSDISQMERSGVEWFEIMTFGGAKRPDPETGVTSEFYYMEEAYRLAERVREVYYELFELPQEEATPERLSAIVQKFVPVFEAALSADFAPDRIVEYAVGEHYYLNLTRHKKAPTLKSFVYKNILPKVLFPYTEDPVSRLKSITPDMLREHWRSGTPALFHRLWGIGLESYNAWRSIQREYDLMGLTGLPLETDPGKINAGVLLGTTTIMGQGFLSPCVVDLERREKLLGILKARISGESVKPDELSLDGLIDLATVMLFLDLIGRKTGDMIEYMDYETAIDHFDSYLYDLSEIEPILGRQDNISDNFELFKTIRKIARAREVIDILWKSVAGGYLAMNNRRIDGELLDIFQWENREEAGDIADKEPKLKHLFGNSGAKYYYHLTVLESRLREKLAGRIEKDPESGKMIIAKTLSNVREELADVEDQCIDWLLDIHESATEEKIDHGEYPGQYSGYNGTPYFVIKNVMDELLLGPDDVFYDLGSGFGRAVLAAGFLTQAGKAMGVELVGERMAECRRVAEKWGLRNVEVIQGDASSDALDLSEGTVFFLFNPFTPGILRKVLAKLERVAENKKIRIVSWGGTLNEYLEEECEKGWLHRKTVIDHFKWEVIIYESDEVEDVEPVIQRTEEREEEKFLGEINTGNRRLFSMVESAMAEAPGKTAGEGIPVDVVVDLSLIPKEDLQANMETWASLILLCRELDNVNFSFELPDLLDGANVPDALANDIENAASEYEAVALLKKEIRGKAVLFGMDGDIEELIKKRINTPRRDNAIEIPIVSKAWLEWMRDRDAEMAPNQYPVALNGITAEDDEQVLLRNFDAALTIGLAKAALVMAQRRDAEKSEEEEKELPGLRKEVFNRLQKVYEVFFGDSVILTEDTLDNMIHPSSTVRRNLAITLALPPILRMPVQQLRDYHAKIQLLLQAA